MFIILIALSQILEDSGGMGKKDKTGYTMTISDFEWWMIPIVLIASADYEESVLY